MNPHPCPKPKFAKGDRVRVTFRGRSVTALVALASANGVSLLVDWTTTDDGMPGGYAGRMPILFARDGVYRDLIEGEPVTLSKASK